MPSLIAVLGFDTGPFNKGVDAAQAKARGAGKGIESAFGGLGNTLAGFATVGGITAAIHSTIEYASKINDLSLRLGMSTDDVQKWDYALKQNGSSIDEAVPFFEKLGKARLRALAGDEDDIKAFAKFGIGLDQVKGDVSNLGLAISEIYEKGGDPQQLIGAMTQLGGRGAESMVAAFREGVRRAFAEAPIISPEDIEKIDEMGDKISKFKSEWQAVAAYSMVAIFNGLTTALDLAAVGLSVVVGALRGAADSITSELIPKIASWATVLNPVGAALKVATVMGGGAVAGAKEMGASALEVDAKNLEKRDAEDKARKDKRDARQKAMDAARAASVAEESAEKKKADAKLKKHQEEATAKLEEELSKKMRANSLGEMSTADKLHALTAERRDILKTLPGLEGDQAYEAAIKAAELDKEIAETMTKRKSEVADKDKKEADEGKKDRKEAAGLAKHSVNSEQQLGAFIFGNYDSAGTAGPELAAINAQMQSERHLAQIVKLLGGSAVSNQTSF